MCRPSSALPRAMPQSPREVGQLGLRAGSAAFSAVNRAGSIYIPRLCTWAGDVCSLLLARFLVWIFVRCSATPGFCKSVRAAAIRAVINPTAWISNGGCLHRATCMTIQMRRCRNYFWSLMITGPVFVRFLRSRNRRVYKCGGLASESPGISEIARMSPG